ncbi:tetratricopeptide repeat protein [Azoarcus olearius]|uniref:Methyltransferase type 11 domain-containing protein n=1 Tax=Azoarcus sp. (strain BH72) TaxID=418699 RepID=A1KCG7_AZOSB|nr:tetratricopeptide repeat protein [Azoarcus olearius]CAL96523.1 conserved hypothetical protein [Azoarcus olearius]
MTTDSALDQLPSEMTLDDALAFATRLHRIGELDAAETIYRRVLDVVPEHPDALNFLAIARHQRGEVEESITLMRRSLALRPDAPGVWNNLGNILLDLGYFDDAGDAYEECLRLAPDEPLVRNNLGVLRRSQGRLEEAEAAYRDVLARDPKNIDAHNNLGNLLAGLGRIEEAVRHYCESVTLMPANPAVRKMLGYAYYMLGRYEEAAEFYRNWLAAEPDNATARHHLAACTGQDVPTRASDVYVESVFDGFAESFDAKLAALTYRAPQLVAGEVARRCGEGRRQLDILDAGCGTGLCGPLLAPHARRLVGVDLSQPMLDKAAARKVYDALVKAELTAFLQGTEADSQDLIVSADTLCYFGALDAVFGAAARALRGNGTLVFTVELSAPEGGEHGYRLAPHGRYTHAAGYVTGELARAGFGDISCVETDLRTEGGKPVRGLLCAARRGAAA